MHDLVESSMSGTVDLEGDPERLPVDVEVRATPRGPTNHLALRFGQPTLAAHLGEVELPE